MQCVRRMLLYYSLPIRRFRANNMDQKNLIQGLRQEQERLEQRVHELVGALEAKKSDSQIKLTKEQILKSKEERDATAALEQLELKDDVSQKQETNAKVAPQVQPKQKQAQKSAAKEPEKPLDVSRLDLRIGRIVEVDRHPDADALYVEKIDCGDSTGPRTVISGLVKHVPIEEMKDRLVVVLCNLKPAKMRGILSEAMVMCASTPEKVELLGTPENVKPGDRVVFDQYPGEADAQLNPKKKIWEQIAPDIKTNDEGVAMYKESEFKVVGVDGKFKSSLRNVNIR